MQQLPPFQEWLVQLTTMVSSVLVGIAAVIGIANFSQWRREMVGRSKIDIARKMLLLGLQFRDEFHAVRSPFTFRGEWHDRPRGDAESASEAQVRDEFYAKAKRLEPLEATMRKLVEAGWEAEVMLDDNGPKLIEPLDALFRELAVSTQMYFEQGLYMAQHPGSSMSAASPIADDNHSKVYGTRNDVFGKQVESAVDELKKQLKSYVR